VDLILDKYGEKKNYKKGEMLFNNGYWPKGVYKILYGKVKIFACGDEGKENIIHIASKSEIIGFRAMLSGLPYKVSAKTLEECCIQYIPKSDFMILMDSNDSFRNKVIVRLSRELGERALFTTTMSQKTVRARLAVSLIQLNDIYHGPISLSRDDLANFIGTATENLIRTLKQFKTEKLIEFKGRTIYIINIDKLNHIGKD